MRVRRYIADNSEQFNALINDKKFVAKWGEMRGERNKRIPPEFVEAFENQPFIANKQFYWHANLDAKMALRPDFPEILRGYFEAAQPLNAFLREAIYS